MECLVLGVEISVAVAGRMMAQRVGSLAAIAGRMMAQKEGWLVGCHREDGAMCFTERGVDFFTFDFSLALFPVIGRMDGWMALNGKLPLLGHHPHP